MVQWLKNLNVLFRHNYLILFFHVLIDISTRDAYSAAQTFYSDLGILAEERGYVGI
jgi:hypothetical membrane protein